MDPAQGRPLSADEVAALAERYLSFLRDHVRRLAGPLVRQRESLSDLVQSALRELFESAPGLAFESEAAFRSWLCTAATHKIVSKHRYHAAQRRAAEREEPLSGGLWDLAAESAVELSPPGAAARGEELERLRDAIDALDEQDRQIVVLRKLLDVPTPAIAERIGMPESTVRWRLARALVELATRLGD